MAGEPSVLLVEGLILVIVDRIIGFFPTVLF